MSNRAVRILLLGGMCALCGALCGCEGQIDESILDAQADYSIRISLPYATVTPAPAQQEAAQALVIDPEGGVIVNDSASILQGEVPEVGGNVGNYKSLRQGNTGLAVQALQTRLQELGYYTQGVTGIFDAATESAVRRFEQTYGTMQTGVATADLQSRLFSADALVYASEAYNEAVVSQYRVLQRGDVGSSVYALQQRLKNLGYPIGELTGVFDNETANAIMLFYEAYGLTASDVANVALQKELYSDSARSYGNGGGDSGNALYVMPEESIEQIQRRLIDLGYLSGEASGAMDRATEIAARLFEEACGQLSSGSLSANLLDMLQSRSAPDFDSFAGQYANLIEGSSGEDVERLQARLVELGFATGTPNGDYGSATTASIQLFQRANGLEETGVASTYTQAVLYASFALNIDGETAISAAPAATAAPETTAGEALAPLAAGSSGAGVLRLQNRLTDLGYASSVTGEYDEITERAISAFQSALGCPSDGAASVGLQAFLYCDAAPNNGAHYFKEEQNFRDLTLESEGDDVTRLQRRIWELGYLDREKVRDSVGRYNQATADAVSALQAAIGYESPDGEASVAFQCYLHSEYSQPAEALE